MKLVLYVDDKEDGKYYTIKDSEITIFTTKADENGVMAAMIAVANYIGEHLHTHSPKYIPPTQYGAMDFTSRLDL
jgi:hypothetical protein